MPDENAQLVPAPADAPQTLAVVPIPDIPRGTEGMEDVAPEDLILPRRRVIQPTSRLSGNPGEFHDNLANASKPAINCVLLRMTKSRVNWGEGDQPLCASNDAVTKRPEYADSGFGPQCANCPEAQWGDDGTPPKCHLTYNFLAADRDEGDSPFILAMHGANVKNAKALLSFFSLRRYPLYAKPIKFTTVSVTGERGRYFEVKFAPQDVPGYDWRPYREMYEGTSAWVIEADRENTRDREAEARQSAQQQQATAQQPQGSGIPF